MYLLANDSQILLCILWTFPLAKTSACNKNTFTMEAYHSAKIKHSQPLIVPLMKQKLR